MQMEIRKMAAEGVIEYAPDNAGFESHLFLLKKQDGTNRPVLNLKALNRYIKPGKFRLMNMYKVQAFLQPGDWMMKMDPSQAYFHVPISASHRRFLRFAATTPSDSAVDRTVCQMTCLPFGLATAPKTSLPFPTGWLNSSVQKA